MEDRVHGEIHAWESSMVQANTGRCINYLSVALTYYPTWPRSVTKAYIHHPARPSLTWAV